MHDIINEGGEESQAEGKVEGLYLAGEGSFDVGLTQMRTQTRRETKIGSCMKNDDKCKDKNWKNLHCGAQQKGSDYWKRVNSINYHFEGQIYRLVPLYIRGA
jgi:hypothetical protein